MKHSLLYDHVYVNSSTDRHIALKGVPVLGYLFLTRQIRVVIWGWLGLGREQHREIIIT
jgi:hypothetical protein